MVLPFKKETRFLFSLLLLATSITLNARNFSDETFLIIDLPSSQNKHLALRNAFAYPNTGISLSLEIDERNNGLITRINDESIPFDEIATMIKNTLARDSTRILPIVIDFNGPQTMLKDAFVNAGLNHLTHYQPIGERWGETETMVQHNERLIIFTYQRIHQGHKMFHYIWNYIADFPKSISETPYFDGNYPNGDFKNELLLIRDYISSYTAIYSQKGRSLDNNQNPYFSNYLINCWQYTGKKPNLLLLPGELINFRDLLGKINTYNTIKGRAQYSGKPLEKVLWKHSERSITYGYFSFPFIEGEELALAPHAPGFRFIPGSVIINQEGNYPKDILFSAKPLPINDKLTGYFPFNKGLDNSIAASIPVVNRNTHIASDIERGNILKLPDQSYLILGKSDNFKIKGSSFTISAWIKLTDVTSQRDYCIVGTQETTFRKGLHLVIRDGRPYFGFFGNDLWSDAFITAESWHHIVFRYDIHNGEQAIFVDGQPAGASLGHASFIGESNLIAGHGLKQLNFINGYIDELCIWNRTLGLDEIKNLYSNDVDLDLKKPIRLSRIIYIIILALLVGAAFALWKLRSKKRHLTQTRRIPLAKKDESNSVYLFGNFCVISRDGINQSHLFTPKIKELFLLLMLFSLKKGKGITTEQMTSLLWQDKSKQKAANNRSVSINKLRKITEHLDGMDIVYEDGKWMMTLTSPLYCDYKEALEIIHQGSLKETQNIDLFKISQRGVFLSNCYAIWLDDTKGYVTNEVIDLLLKFAEKLDQSNDNELLDAVVQRILLADDLNENALRLQLALLVKRDSKHLAQFTFKQFKINYKTTYNEDYKLSFDQFINNRF